jgi:anaerobic selenocysteine-containing dehydrogenase
MTRKLSRRDFIKTAGISAAATAVLTGCGPASRYLVREPYIRMPEYTYNGQSTFYATSCGECPAGCGTVVRTMQGRALKIEGNPNHPVNLGKTCARGQIALEGLYNPDRYQFPAKRQQRGSEDLSQISWDDGITLVADALSNNQPGEIAMLCGLTSDHFFDLATEITAALGAPPPLRYSAFETIEGRATLAKASQQVFGVATIPFFDLANADVTFSFGANFLGTYLSPVAYGRGFAYMRQGRTGKRGYLVHFEPRISQTGVVADEWIPVAPGTEGLVAIAIGRLVAENKGGSIPAVYQNVDLSSIESASGVSLSELQRLAGLFANAEHALAIPGESALTASNGLEAGDAILVLNSYVDNPGKPGGVFLTPLLPVHPETPSIPNTVAEVQDLITRMNSGAIKVLFIHGVNPVYELPPALGFLAAMGKVPSVISFASFPDETSLQADIILPTHTPLESWGYQKIITGTDRPAISGFQPVVTPLYDTQAACDVLLGAVQAIGGDLADAVPYTDEVDFLQQSLQALTKERGFFTSADMRNFWPMWQQNGGWWNESAGLASPYGQAALSVNLSQTAPEFDDGYDFYLMPYFSTLLSDGSGANRPWLQEIPDPTTTVEWNTWVEINPTTAETLGIAEYDVLKVTSPYGELQAVVYMYPAIRPDTIGIPFGQGHSAYGRYAQNRGANVANLLGTRLNGANDLALYSFKVNVEKTGEQFILARFEGNLGQYDIP